MLMENSGLPEYSNAFIPTRENNGEGDGGAAEGFSEEEEKGGDGPTWTPNRWPREETLTLLKIRSEMNTAFRDSSPKAPLWEQVSRRLTDLGYNRSAKKCKEKFENISKYHRRVKEGHPVRSNGKTYRFFEQLEALDNNPLLFGPPAVKNDASLIGTAVDTMKINPENVIRDAMPCSILIPFENTVDKSGSATSSSSEESEGITKKKKKLAEFFEMLMKQVVEKQENLQKKFMEVLEKCEREQMVREEIWKSQELARIKRERELLAQERSIAAAKDAAVLALLKKFTEQEGPLQSPDNIQVQNLVPQGNEKEKENGDSGNIIDKLQVTNHGGFSMQLSSSRWPKAEVDALINLRTNLDMHYQGNGSKVPLWEEISSAMKRLGYDRSAKRCKEKWENINKYFKKMKEKNKRRPEDSKTCPYFLQLETLYSKKPRIVADSTGSASDTKAEELLLHRMGGQEVQQPPKSVTDYENQENNCNNQKGYVQRGEGDECEIVDDNNSSPSMAING